LSRFLSFIINHPVVKEDGLLASFLSETSFEAWRKRTSLSLEEESTTKRVDRNEEMNIPSDLEEKIALVRSRLGTLIDTWQKICVFAERIIKRREASAVWRLCST
jgi:sorting nexin-8